MKSKAITGIYLLSRRIKFLSTKQKSSFPILIPSILSWINQPVSGKASRILDVARRLDTQLVEIMMVFHVIKDPEVYRAMLEETGGILSKWTTAAKKMRENIIVCNYRFVRNVSRNAEDDSWLITGLNHWIPREYLQAQ